MSATAHASVGTERTTWSFVIRDRAIVAFVSILVVLPSALFATALRTIPALAVIVGCFGALALIVGRAATSQPDCLQTATNIPRLVVCVASALVILSLGGETHLFFSTPDWLIRDAVLSDLVQQGYLVGYRVGSVDYLLRAPLGMYIVPALVGQAFGLLAAHITLLAQNSLFLGAIFYLLATLGRGWRHLAILVLFAGLSLAGGLISLASNPRPGIPFWLHWGLDQWHPYFQYSGSIVQFFWVPNHALPGWWLATLFLLQRRSSVDVATLGVTVAALSFWSPLAIVPAVPWLVYCAARAWRQVFLSRRTWLGLASAVCFLPILAYLLSASLSIEHASQLGNPDFVFWYAFFIIVQLPTFVFLAFFRREIPQELRALVVVNGLVLLALPFFNFGPHNDLVMRGSIASLTIIAFAFGFVVIRLTERRALGAVAGWALVLAASPSAAVEIGRALATPRYGISSCSLMQASEATGDQGIPANYMTPSDGVPAWLLDARAAQAAPIVQRTCWPDLTQPRYFGVTYKTVSKP